MAVNLENLIPVRCRECITLRTTVVRQSDLIDRCAALIEGGAEDQNRDLTTIMDQLAKVESDAESLVLAFIGRCASRDEIVPETQCRVPTSEWKDIV